MRLPSFLHSILWAIYMYITAIYCSLYVVQCCIRSINSCSCAWWNLLHTGMKQWQKVICILYLWKLSEIFVDFFSFHLDDLNGTRATSRMLCEILVVHMNSCQFQLMGTELMNFFTSYISTIPPHLLAHCWNLGTSI